MAYASIASIAPQFENYPNYWLKAYEQGTTTPKVMATDSTGATTVSKFEINSDGFIRTAGAALVIPYIDGAYDLYLFSTAALADSNTTGGAIQLAENITAAATAGAGAAPVYEDTAALMAANTNKEYAVGDIVIVKDRADGIFDVVLTTSVTPNTFNIIISTANALISFALRANGVANVKSFGAVGDGATNDQSAIDETVTFCKTTGSLLVIPIGTYNAALNVDWCIPNTSASNIIADPRFDPSDPQQGGTPGKVFDINMDSNAVFMLRSELSRIRGNVDIKLGKFSTELIICNVEHAKISGLETIGGVLSLAYRSSDVSSERYPLQWFYWIPDAGLTDLSNGSLYWVDFDNCIMNRGMILGGTKLDGYATNEVRFNNSGMFGGGVNNTSAEESYLDNRGCGVYLDMTGGHTDGITFSNCDLSYNTFPFWNNANNPVQFIGLYYESNTNNFLTKNGTTASPYAANILSGWDYDRDNASRNERTSLRAQGFNLGTNNGGGSNYSSFNIADFGGNILLKNGDESANIGKIGNTTSQAGTGQCAYFQSETNENGVNQQTMKIGHRSGSNYNRAYTFKEIVNLNYGAGSSVTATYQGALASMEANGTIEISCMGGVATSTSGTPAVYKASISKTGVADWVITTIYGSLIGTRITLTLSTQGVHDLRVAIGHTGGVDNGTFNGVLHVETNIAGRDAEATGAESRWVIV